MARTKQTPRKLTGGKAPRRPFRGGVGTITYTDGGVYDGDFVDGKAQGAATYKYPNGDVFRGMWFDDQPFRGTMKYAEGTVFKGKWKDGKRHGDGVMTYHNGIVYEGEWVDNLRHGTGTCKIPTGNEYTGGWKNGKRHGKATEKTTSGVYEGEWVDGDRCGVFTFKEASTGVEYKQVYSQNGNLLSNKRLATLSYGPPSQRPRRNEPVDVVLLSEEHKTCGICFVEYATETDDESAKRQLPVLGTCGHCCCLGCVLDAQNSARATNGAAPETIGCMYCRKEGAFRPGEPVYDRRLMGLLTSAIPVKDHRSV